MGAGGKAGGVNGRRHRFLTGCSACTCQRRSNRFVDGLRLKGPFVVAEEGDGDDERAHDVVARAVELYCRRLKYYEQADSAPSSPSGGEYSQTWSSLPRRPVQAAETRVVGKP